MMKHHKQRRILRMKHTKLPACINTDTNSLPNASQPTLLAYLRGASQQQRGVMLAILAALGFSFKAIFVKLSYQAAAIDASTLLALRMSMALPLFLLMGGGATLRSWGQLKSKDKWKITALGVVGYYGSSLLDFMGLEYISAGLERLILFTYPAITVILGILFWGKRADKRLLLALLLSYLGIALGFVHDASVSTNLRQLMIGGALVFGCAILYALYNAGSEDLIKRLGALPFTVLSLCITTAAVLLHFVIQQPLAKALHLPWQVYLYSAAMAVFSTVLPIFWQASAIKYLGAAKAVLIGTLGPVLTIFFSWYLLAEPISLEQILGTLLVVAGVLLVAKSKAN